MIPSQLINDSSALTTGGRSTLKRYGLAVLTSAAAFLTASSLHRPLIELSPFLLFYAAVAISSWYGGFGPGLLAVLIGSFTTAYYVFEPQGSVLVRDPLDLGRPLLFLLVGALISFLNGQLRKSKRLCEIEAHVARHNEARARRLSEANLIGVFFADLCGTICAGNDEFLRLAGCTREQVRAGKINWLALTAPEHRHLDDKAVDELKCCRVCTPYERVHRLSDGRRIPVLVGCALLDDPPDECVGFVLDLTDRKRAEEELRVHQDRLAAMSSELMLAEERERRRIAGVLHDSVGQTLALVKLQLGAIAHSDAGEGVADALSTTIELLDQAIGCTRSLTSDISPPVLYELGLEAAVRWLAGRIQEQHGIAIEVRDDRQPKPLDDAARLVLFEAVRELLVNVVKHANAHTCVISMERDGEKARITVRDDGKGFASAGSTREDFRSNDGFGLFNIRERLNRLRGSAEIRAQPGQGTGITLVVPLARPTEHADDPADTASTLA